MWRRCSTSGWSCMAIRSGSITPRWPRVASGGRQGVERGRWNTVTKPDAAGSVIAYAKVGARARTEYHLYVALADALARTRVALHVPRAIAFSAEHDTLLIQSAADVGAYETTLWTLLGVLGIVGLVLYAWLLLEFLRSILPVLRNWRLRGPDFLIVAWAGMALIGAFFTCVLFGSYPSLEIFLAILAKGLIEDRRKETVPLIARSVSSLPSITLPKNEPVAT